MKKIIALAVSLLVAIGLRASLVEYTYSGKVDVIGGYGQGAFGFHGVMIYDTGSSVVTFVDWHSDKVLHSNTVTNFQVVTVNGALSKSYTVIAGSSSGIDTNGYYHLDDYMIQGQNVTLLVSSNNSITFPKRLAGSNNREIIPDDSGEPWLETWGETMTFWATRTKADNNQNLTMDQAVSSLIAWLEQKGYTKGN